MIKYVFFDTVGTLLRKQGLYTNIQKSIEEFGFQVSLDDIKSKHKLLSEIIFFPDRTCVDFYNKFNAELLYLLGIVPTEKLLKTIYKNCSYLAWEVFEDTKILFELKNPIGVISNFNITLKETLEQFFGPIFENIFVSEELEVAKPKIEFYQKALKKIPFTPNEILYVGDSIKLDLEPAIKLGINILIIDRDNFYPNLKNKISSLTQITNFL